MASTGIVFKNSFRAAVWAGLVVSVICGVRLVAVPYIDPDLFLSGWIGDYVLQNHALPNSFGLTTFSAINVPFVPQEWVLGVAAALSFHYHMIWLLALATAVFIGGAIVFVALRADRFGATIPATLICCLYVVVDFFGTIAIKQQDFMWVFLAALLYLLDFDGPVIFWSLPLIALWSNLHGSAVVAIPVLWIGAAAAWYRQGFRGAYQRCVLALLAPFALLLTPFGLQLPAMVWHVVTNPAARVTDEFARPGIHHVFFWGGGFVLLLMMLPYARTLLKERLADVLYVALFSAMTFSAIRNSALLAVACAPLAARSLTLLLRAANQELLRFVRLFGIVLVGSTCVVFSYIDLGVPISRAIGGPNPFDRLVVAMQSLASTPGEHRLFCEDYAFCSLALRAGGIRIYMNSALPAFPLKVIYDYDDARFAKPGWQGILSRYRVNLILTKENSRFDKALLRDPAWQRIASSGDYRFYAIRRTTARARPPRRSPLQVSRSDNRRLRKA